MKNLNILQQLKHYGITPNKTFGQNFLLDEVVLHEIVEAAELTPNDLVIEVGPGIGNLTRLLLEKAGHVISVEKDTSLTSVLRDIKQDFPNYYFELGDVLHTTPRGLVENASAKNRSFTGVSPDSYKVVANIPYYITGKIIRHFLAQHPRPSLMVLLMQKEVAENLTANEGDLNILGISVQLYGKVEYVKRVPSDSFYPVPKVDSAIVKIDLRQKSPFLIKDERQFFRVLKACFLGKRKQIHNTLKNNLKLDELTVQELLSNIEIDPKTRPQQLSIQKWIELSEEISLLEHKKRFPPSRE
ncbi:MAG TPA: 16S rRNA (adenine(1518)-N(6)/adenine(1519)-N(6))-dimethyltransferase RsmA [Patescibacteria group bacterium]|nr:16S rRNA (adenine(1518)-N(6)/adenine(1519)-N(6))-dimethyltransferase RsmA [Patescibacteria group bacterium]